MFFNIQALRSVAAIFVLLYHAGPHYNAIIGGESIITKILSWGYVGVDVFFVISGFVTTLSITSKRITLDNQFIFLKKRFFRVYLGYVPFFFMMLACIYITSPEYITNLSLFNSFFLTTIYMDKLVLPVTWSLSYELYFYLLLSFLFLIRPKNTTFIFLFLTVLFINVFSERESIFFMSPFVLEFLFGSLVCIYREKLSNCNGMVVSCIVICVLSFLFGMGFKGWNGLVRVSTFGVFATALLLIAILFESKNMVFNKLLIMLGDSSYTLYLSHLIFLSLFYHTGLRDIISQQSEIVATLGFIGYMVFIIIVSHIYSKMIELPIYRASIKSMRKFQ